jgi:hypothetical protein
MFYFKDNSYSSTLKTLYILEGKVLNECVILYLNNTFNK